VNKISNSLWSGNPSHILHSQFASCRLNSRDCAMLCQFFNHFHTCILTIILSTISLAIILFISVEYLLECGRKTPKHIGGLPFVCMLLYLIPAQLLKYSCRREKNYHMPAFIAKMYNMWGFFSMLHIYASVIWCLITKEILPIKRDMITNRPTRFRQYSHWRLRFLFWVDQDIKC